jgi:hypothetical protein
MSINVIKRYALVDISPVEDQLVRASQGEAPATTTTTAAPCRGK